MAERFEVTVESAHNLATPAGASASIQDSAPDADIESILDVVRNHLEAIEPGGGVTLKVKALT